MTGGAGESIVLRWRGGDATCLVDGVDGGGRERGLGLGDIVSREACRSLARRRRSRGVGERLRGGRESQRRAMDGEEGRDGMGMYK